MTITTEEAEALARRYDERVAQWRGLVDAMNEGPAKEARTEKGAATAEEHERTANALRTLAAERDIANEQIYGLAEEREKWKDRAECAEAKPDKLRDAVTAVIIAYEHDIAQGVEPSEDRRRVIAVLRAALEGEE